MVAFSQLQVTKVTKRFINLTRIPLDILLMLFELDLHALDCYLS